MKPFSIRVKSSFEGPLHITAVSKKINRVSEMTNTLLLFMEVNFADIRCDFDNDNGQHKFS